MTEAEYSAVEPPQENEQSYDQAQANLRQKVLSKALPDVVFDGWRESVFEDAIIKADVDPALARVTFPDGIHDLVIYFHKSGDEKMKERLPARLNEMGPLRFNEKIAEAVKLRLEIANENKDAVRRAASYFGMPQRLSDAAALNWGTSDAIWRALGDTARDFSFYSKRTTLSAVYASSVLYWLQSEDPTMADVRAFVDRRIANVMSFGKFTAKIKSFVPSQK